MKERIPYLLEIYNAFKSNDLKSRLKHFEILTNSLFILTQSLYDNKVQIKHHHAEIENKYFRHGMANHSIIKLLKSNRFFIINQQIDITDLFSIFSLTRMQIESFSIMYYLFFDNIETIEKDFRYDIYKLHGLQKQNNFPVTLKRNQEKKKIIEGEIETLIKKIKEYSKFQESNQKEQNQYLKPKNAKLLSTKDILKNSGIDSSRINDMWNLYSNHAHSEHISDRQYNYIYKNKKSTLEESLTVISINTILTSHLCHLISNEFEGVKKKYEELNLGDQVQIEIWSKIKNK